MATNSTKRVLYSYWRSSAAYRLRIALNLKALDYETVSVSLIDGEHQQPDYLAINPQGLVPFLIDGDVSIGQSMAILEYLDERYTQVPLLPANAQARALARQIANIISCDIHPLCNLRVLKYLQQPLSASDSEKQQWYAHWVSSGFVAIEALLESHKAYDFCVGDTPSFADICLVPQVYNAHRFNISLDRFPRISAIAQHCNEWPAFANAAPDSQRK